MDIWQQVKKLEEERACIMDITGGLVTKIARALEILENADDAVEAATLAAQELGKEFKNV